MPGKEIGIRARSAAECASIFFEGSLFCKKGWTALLIFVVSSEVGFNRDEN
jgi:hypothetical protein